MRASLTTLAASVLVAACTTSAPEGEAGRAPTPAAAPAAAAAAAVVAPAASPDCCAAAGARVARTHRVSAIATRRFTHEELWAAAGPALRSPALRVTEVGRSVQGRPIRAVTYGS